MKKDISTKKMKIKLNNKKFKTLEQLVNYMRFHNIEEVEFIEEDENIENSKVIELKNYNR